MRLRTRISLLVASAVALAILVVAGLAVVIAQRQAVAAVDTQLNERARLLAGVDLSRQNDNRPIPRRILEADTLVQTINRSGEVLTVTNTRVELPVSDADVEVAVEQRGTARRTVTVEDVRVRVLTVPGGRQRAVMLARPLTEAEDGLRGLRNLVAIVAGVGVLGAAAVGWVVGERAVRPVRRLSDAASRVAETQQLDQSIEVERNDELGELARDFNAMLGALATSREQQHRLVTDASHELRTPLTSLRTNIELLQRATRRSGERSDLDDVRDEVMTDVVFELGELTSLVDELVELATDRHQGAPTEPMRLGDAVVRVLDRARRRTDSDIVLTVDDAAASIIAVPALVERAISNLVHNAIKFGPAGSPIDVTLTGGEVRVRDRGPGVPVEERTKIFERFYRSDEARALAGSGLGLSIVHHVAQSFGGRVWVEDPSDGGAGAEFVIQFPVVLGG